MHLLKCSCLFPESKAIDSLTFDCTIDYDDMEDGEILWTQPNKFDYSGAHEVQGGVRKEHNGLKVNLVLSSDPLEQRLSWPVQLIWKLFIVKNKDRKLKDTREMDCRLEDLSKDPDWRQCIDIQFADLKSDKLVDASGGSVTLMWVVEITIFQCPTKQTQQSEIIAREIVRYLSPANRKTSKQNVQHVSDKLQKYGAKPFSLDSDDTDELGEKLMDKNVAASLSSLAESKAIDSLTFGCTIDYDDMEDGDILWTQPNKLDYSGAHEVQGGVMKEDNGLKVNLVLSSDPREKTLSLPVQLIWKVFIVKNKDRKLKDTREMDCRLEDLSKDTDWRQCIDIQFADLKSDKTVDASDGSVTLMWVVEITNFQSPMRQTRQSNIIAREIAHTMNFRPTVHAFQGQKYHDRLVSSDNDNTREPRQNFMDENVPEKWSSLAGEDKEVSSSPDVTKGRPKIMDAGDQLRQETTILLLGQKESGKSDVGNAILGMQAFNSSTREKSVILPAWAEIDTETKEYELMLVDGPDLEDIDLNKLQGKEGTCDKLGLAMGLCEDGVDAFVLVLKYGDPLTKDHRIVIKAAGKMLGENWLSNNGIVVMCGGNDWYDDIKKKNKNISFEQWCRYQNDAYGNIFSKCGYRCILFENSEPNEEHKQKLFEYLMSWTKQIRKNYGRYTNEHFKAAATNLAKFIDKLNYPILHIKIQKGTSLLTSKCMKLDTKLAYSEKMKVFGAILDRANGLLNDIAEENNKTEKLDELKAKVTELRERAHRAEKNLLESPESVINDFEGIKRSAETVEDLRTDLDLWPKFAEAALKGLKVGFGVSFVAGGLLALFGLPIADPVAVVSGAVGRAMGASALLYGVPKFKINTTPGPEEKNLKAVSKPRQSSVDKPRQSSVDKPRQRITILLLGKEANGKAAVGNAILGMEAFKRSTTGNSLLPAWAEFDTETEEYELMVVDGPDVNAMNLEKLQGRGACENLELAMGFCEHGVDLFVLVMSYNDRFTENERSILHALRSMLGPDWLSRHGIVVMTHGDTSSDEMKRTSKYFTEWCIRNDGSYGGFFSECRQRCFLFDIERPDNRLKQATFQELITVAKQMKDTYGPCNNKHFKAAVANRDTLIAHLNAPIFDMKIQKEISLLTSKCTRLSDKLLYGEKMKLIGAVIDRADGLLNNIARIDKGAGKLSKLNTTVKKLKEQVVQAERGLRASPETRLGDYMDMQACTEMLEDMRRDPSLWEDFKGEALKGLKESNESLTLGAVGLILHEAGIRK